MVLFQVLVWAFLCLAERLFFHNSIQKNNGHMPKTAKAEDSTMSLQADFQAAGNNKSLMAKAIEDNEAEIEARLSGAGATAEEIGGVVAWIATWVDDAAVHTALDVLGDWIHDHLRAKKSPLTPAIRPIFGMLATQVPTVLAVLKAGGGSVDVNRVRDYVMGVVKSMSKPGIPSVPPPPIGRAHLALSEEKKRALAVLREFFLLAQTMDLPNEMRGYWSVARAHGHAIYTDPAHGADLPDITPDELLAVLDIAIDIRGGDLSRADELNELIRKFAVYFALVELTGAKELPLWEQVVAGVGDRVDGAVNRQDVREWVVGLAQSHGPRAFQRARQIFGTVIRWAAGSLVAAVVMYAVAFTLLATGMFGNFSRIFESWQVTWMAMGLTFLSGPVVVLIFGAWIVPIDNPTIRGMRWLGRWWWTFAIGLTLAWGFGIALILCAIWAMDAGMLTTSAPQTATNLVIWGCMISGLLLLIAARFTLPIAGDILNAVRALWQGVSPLHEGTIGRRIIEALQAGDKLPPIALKSKKWNDEPGRLISIGTTLSIAFVAIVMVNILFWMLTGPTSWTLLGSIALLLSVFLFAEMTRKWIWRFSPTEVKDEVAGARKLIRGLMLSIVLMMLLGFGVLCAFGAENLVHASNVWHKAVDRTVDWTEEQVDDGSSPRGTDDGRVDEIRRRHK
ncbi:hypothetical protein CO057_02315 [Candidatus Uhrbacteria bacterium CG_4_9_14_0_2_um_filter_41_50]|uniref:Uncharacterized protein n=1 Tax=Candidatus Uhrbacteria bacterium CG_4_9_14_0_2_um_filter_41_50 TaxID=1975031 RepID=A0A2M8EP70_9BACT|nr:MAG: hypothetical protein COY24_00250 [Candidatus Uhrbacteria bacterium CG_4_10_14_0_2_um_filter_41_21]PJB84627.1 MAG: hypothetical protein CO086_02605 [Candidatus Uhrbacteria bacterium CG_4_9_14_0_8_um_filter_41_16]PJC24544.1 MAG: hypothetical protein CO057_02315 [Candidatus Uhrbacteria bacterium CG_4_9_14_0_2_um_filter_41_50]